MNEQTLITVPVLIALAALSERALERLPSFQSTSPETKRVIALLIAALIGVVVGAVESALTGQSYHELLYIIVSALAQQLAHTIAAAQKDN